ncbi:FAD/NAD(P)-binding protein [Amycolatopsis sp. NPDC049252]|uniref:FAD/NAD(P)-binding protein n=1 Tax=Amycolatopsis sp. NPDC049252 TaxID=3363933 RepID=UPI00371F6526
MTEPMLPVPYRVDRRTAQTRDTATLRLVPADRALASFRPGQFTMLHARGVGEVAISISGDPSTVDGVLEQTVRDVGAVSHALHAAEPGTVLGVRGPFGRGWDVESARGGDVVIVAGGVGLAPLRPVVLAVLAARAAYGRVLLVAGARTPAEFLYRDEFAGWARSIEVLRTVDRPAPGWTGEVGFVTEPLARFTPGPGATTAFLCGPEPMMRFSAQVLLRKGVAAEDIRVSLERNMQCGTALCGHCQLGPLLLCRDGPVVSYAEAEPLLLVREL